MVEKFAPSLESLFSFGFEGGSLGCPRSFAGISRTQVCAKNQVGMNGDTFSTKAPKECSMKFVAPFKGMFLTRGNILRIDFCS